MTAEEASRIAMDARGLYGLAGYRVSGAERRWIEIVEGAPPSLAPAAPGPVRDVAAWVVRLKREAGFAEVAVDDADGSIVRVRKGRQGV